MNRRDTAAAPQPLQGRPDRFARVPWPAVAVFVVSACALAWLVALPLWLVDFEEQAYTALFGVLAQAMMFTPALAAVIVVFLMKAPRGERMRLLGMWPLRPANRVVWFVAAMTVAPLLLVIATLGVSAMFGWVQLDLVHFSGFQQMLDDQLSALGPEVEQTAKAALPPLGVMVAIQIAAVPLNSLLNVLPTFGEELGWRGWLLPALRPLGVWPSLLLSGAVWGVWHSPVILLGYNFNRTDLSGVALMTVGCVIWGVFFGWLRLRSASLWPAVIAHGSLNSSAALVLMLPSTAVPFDLALVNPLGVAGWIVLAIVVVVLWACGQFRREPQLAPPRPRWVAPAASAEGEKL